jgi:hypothetical protein
MNSQPSMMTPVWTHKELASMKAQFEGAPNGRMAYHVMFKAIAKKFNTRMAQDAFRHAGPETLRSFFDFRAPPTPGSVV